MLADPDRRARLAIGLEGLALNPNQGWMQSLQSGIDTRAEDRRMNQTAQWLRSQPGGEQFAAYFEATGDAQGAFQGYLQSQQPVAGPDPTAAIQNYEYLLSQGVDAETAATQAFGGGGTSIDINTAPTGPQIGTIPQGYQLVQDPETGTSRMERIPGGPEDTTETRSLAELGYDTKFAIVNDEITNALDIVNESGNWAAGYGSALSALPNTPARELAAAITTIKANLGFEELQAMRDASPTGGALGQVTERELAYLQSVQGSLDQARGPEELAATLREIQQRREAFRREREQIMSGAGQAVQQTGVRRYNPETGQLE